MDYRKINSHVILLLVVSIVGVAVAMLSRLIILDKGSDIGTANIVFVIILGICIVVYLVIILTLGHLIDSWFIQKLPRPKVNSTKNQIINATNEKENTNEQDPQEQIIEESIPIQAIELIRQGSEKRYQEKLSAKIQTFQDYTHLIMAPYITNDELVKLDQYIDYYAREEPLPKDIIPLKPKKIINLDMYHFGWNMSHYFGFQKQNVAVWLMQVFEYLQNASSSDITKKLHDSTKNEYNIPIIEDIPKYLKEQKS
ncbi:MAG: magnesium transporter [Dysgonomonas sp.]